jgi:hypothetical protein
VRRRPGIGDLYVGLDGNAERRSDSHRGIERLVIDAGYVTISPDDAVAQTSTIAFDASTFEIWSALLNGARLVIVPKGARARRPCRVYCREPDQYHVRDRGAAARSSAKLRQRFANCAS